MYLDPAAEAIVYLITMGGFEYGVLERSVNTIRSCLFSCAKFRMGTLDGVE